MDAVECWRASMLDGDFESAWRISDRLRPAVWDGTALEGNHVLVECRHGLGDTVFFARYFPEIARIARRLTVSPQPELRRLLAHVPGVEIGAGPADVKVESTELAYIFRTTIDTIPARVPYICVPRPGRRKQRDFRAGLAWASGVYNPLRSVSLAGLEPLASVRGVAWTPLQHGPAFADARQHGRVFGFDDASDPTGTDALDTAARLFDLDLIVTPDTLVAHIAGALGIPTWTLLPYDADWRWMRDREDSPWYPGMRLFRQRRPGDWAEVVVRVRAELLSVAARASPA